MIDIDNLARLARIEITAEAKPKLEKDMESILEYFAELAKVPVSSGDTPRTKVWNTNVLREDSVTTEPGQYTEPILQNAPKREGEHVAVKAIFGER